ncbi:Protein timeless like protein [Melipona quadrifasciata]|uniref:Protein timeless like protein n=1 Tax=Melipona quadrifasciata TaxID=166423 RepID=A0A0M9A2C1_9HYME|nr:Protein timeless like protein [Melipona quadrifasciata]
MSTNLQQTEGEESRHIDKEILYDLMKIKLLTPGIASFDGTSSNVFSSATLVQICSPSVEFQTLTILVSMNYIITLSHLTGLYLGIRSVSIDLTEFQINPLEVCAVVDEEPAAESEAHEDGIVERLLNNVSEEEDEEENAPNQYSTVVETDFKFSEFVHRFANVKIVRAMLILLRQFDKNTDEVNHYVNKMLHRIAWDCKMPAMMFQASMFSVFQRILESKYHGHKELQKFAVFIIRRFVEVAQKNRKAYMELLFWKTTRDATEVVEGYNAETDNKKVSRSLWTETQEDELRTLFMEHQTNKYPQDVVDWILEHINQERTRRGIIKKLKEMCLIVNSKFKILWNSFVFFGFTSFMLPIVSKLRKEKVQAVGLDLRTMSSQKGQSSAKDPENPEFSPVLQKVRNVTVGNFEENLHENVPLKRDPAFAWPLNSRFLSAKDSSKSNLIFISNSETVVTKLKAACSADPRFHPLKVVGREMQEQVWINNSDKRFSKNKISDRMPYMSKVLIEQFSNTDVLCNNRQTHADVTTMINRMLNRTLFQAVRSQVQKRLPKEWSESEVAQLTELWGELKHDDGAALCFVQADPIDLIFNGLTIKRPKPKIKEKLLELGLATDRKEFRKKRSRKSNHGKSSWETRSASNSDENESSDEEAWKSWSNKNRASNKPADKETKKNTRKQPTMVYTNEQLSGLLKDVIDKNMNEALEWIKESLLDVLDDRDEESTEGIPLVPLTDYSSTAMDSPSFQKLIRAMGFTPPADEQESYWRIPSNIPVSLIRKRCDLIESVLTGNFIFEVPDSDDGKSSGSEDEDALENIKKYFALKDEPRPSTSRNVDSDHSKSNLTKKTALRTSISVSIERIDTEIKEAEAENSQSVEKSNSGKGKSGGRIVNIIYDSSDSELEIKTNEDDGKRFRSDGSDKENKTVKKRRLLDSDEEKEPLMSQNTKKRHSRSIISDDDED